MSDLLASDLGGYGALFSGDYLVRANPTELNGLGAITIQALVQLSSTTGDKPIFIAGPTTGSDFGLHLRFDVETGRLMFTIRVGANSTTVESQDGVMPAIGVPMLVAAIWTSGQAPKLYAGGGMLELAVAGTALTGTTNATLGAASSEALIGYNRAVGTKWDGYLADVMVSARALSEGHLQTQELNYLTPRQFYGVGSVNRVVEPNLSPVLPPIQATATVGADAEVDPAAIAYEPDPGQVKTLTSHTGTAGGTFSIVGGRARFRPSSAGRFLSTAAVVDNGTPQKRSLGLILWLASGAPPVTTFPRVPPAATATLRVPEDYATITAALAAASAGNHISVANGTYREEITSAKSGSAAGGYIVIKARNHLGATLAGDTDGTTNSWKFTGSYIWVTGFICNNPQTGSPNFESSGKNRYYNSDRPEYQFRLAGSNLRVTNCQINSPCGIGIANSCNGIDICFNIFTMNFAPRWSQANAIYMGHSPANSAGPNNILIARNKGTADAAVTHWVANASDPSVKGNDNDGRYWFYSGNNEPGNNNTGNNRSVRFVENFIEMVNTPVGIYAKRGYEHRRNFIRAKNAAFNQRHGGYSKADGTVFSGLTDDKRALIVGCNFDKGIFRLNDTDHLVVSCRFGENAELYYGARRTQGTSLSDYNINPNPGWIQAASRVIFVGCTFTGQLRAGEDESSGGNKYKVWGAAEEARWGASQPAQGDTIKGVKNYPASVTSPAQPTDANSRFVRITNLYGEATVASGTAGYQVFGDNDNGGYGALVQAYVTRAELEFATGCNAA